MRYWSREPLADLDAARRMVQEEIEWGQSGTAINWGIALPDDELIGKANLFHFDTGNRRAEVGYVLQRRYWNRGLMSEALTAVLDWAFGELALHRIEADVDPDNRASLALLEKFGFRCEGVLRERWFVYGKWHDSVALGLLADDYRAARSSRGD
jgi:ribosomal-protein-alanine N-acetyltransferase